MFSVDDPATTLLSPFAMDWRTFLIMLAKAALRVWAEELERPDRKRRKKEAPPKPPKPKASEPSRPPQSSKPSQPQYAEQSAESAGWGAQAAPKPVPVLRIETDEGSIVSPLSVIGGPAYVAPRAQRERKPGESRRARRGAQAEVTGLEPPLRTPAMEAFAEQVRAQAKATVVRREEEAQRELKAQREREVAAAKAAHDGAGSPPRRRRAGEPLVTAQLTPATILLLTLGAPMADACEAAA